MYKRQAQAARRGGGDARDGGARRPERRLVPVRAVRDRLPGAERVDGALLAAAAPRAHARPRRRRAAVAPAALHSPRRDGRRARRARNLGARRASRRARPPAAAALPRPSQRLRLAEGARARRRAGAQFSRNSLRNSPRISLAPTHRYSSPSCSRRRRRSENRRRRRARRRLRSTRCKRRSRSFSRC